MMNDFYTKLFEKFQTNTTAEDWRLFNAMCDYMEVMKDPRGPVIEWTEDMLTKYTELLHAYHEWVMSKTKMVLTDPHD